uniref:Uncharacterized protein n=1 Tax=Rhizophora mucronata TaxID=61149 RepID=A0A2P2QNY2_RHIMU
MLFSFNEHDALAIVVCQLLKRDFLVVIIGSRSAFCS